MLQDPCRNPAPFEFAPDSIMTTARTWRTTMTALSSIALLLLLSAAHSAAFGIAAPRMLFLVKQQGPVLTYHNGTLLRGNVPLHLLWYGSFTASQRAVVTDFILSLNPQEQDSPPPLPSVFSWWQTTDKYKGKPTRLILANQVFLQDYRLGKSLTLEQIRDLVTSEADAEATGISVLLTSDDVTVDGFCRSLCGLHGDVGSNESLPYIWVGNPGTQCPGHCSWPFAQPPHGPQTPPLTAPNGDVGVDGMVINLATLLAGTVTNPFDGGYYQGPATLPMEAVSVCTGKFGKGAYPGNPGAVMVDQTTGASFNAYGLYGRKYLLPAMWDPETSQCSTLV